jgi:hypothetical protein
VRREALLCDASRACFPMAGCASSTTASPASKQEATHQTPAKSAHHTTTVHPHHNTILPTLALPSPKALSSPTNTHST